MGMSGGSIGSTGGPGSDISGGMFGGIRSLFGGPARANISRPVVQGPNRADYAPGVPRPVVAQPNRSDFGTAGPRPTVARPDVSDFSHWGGLPDRSAIDEAAGAAREARAAFNDPTHTSAFANLMGLAQEQTASAEGEANRRAEDATSRAGYTGGFHAGAKQAAQDRMKAVSETGFAGAAQIRGEEAGVYGNALSNLNSGVSAYNEQMNTRNIAFGNAVAESDRNRASLDAEYARQVNEANVAFGNALSSSRETQGHLDLGFADLVNRSNMNYADAAAHARELQAQLDQAYNGSLIDNAKYTQMQRSLSAEWATAQAQLKEKAREFDTTSAEDKRRFDLTRGDSLNLQDKAARSQGIDPTTGRRYGYANPAPGGMSSLY